MTTLALSAPAAAEGRREHADGTLHIALDLNTTALSEPDFPGGGGAALRIGSELDAALAALILEAVGSYTSFAPDHRFYAGLLGARLAVGRIIEPSVFAHLGVAKVTQPTGPVIAPMIDAGLALDFTLLPLINLGLHGAYNSTLGSDSYTPHRWLTLGVHAALVF